MWPGFRARFGLVIEGITGQNLGPGLALEDAIQAGQTVHFSLDAATYPALATKIGAWVLLDLVRVAAKQPGSCLVIVDEFSALGREGRHVIPLLARTREAGIMCVLATQGLADLARVEPNLPSKSGRTPPFDWHSARAPLKTKRGGAPSSAVRPSHSQQTRGVAGRKCALRSA